MTEILWRSYKSYSGPLIRGTAPVALPRGDDTHVARAYLLTTQVESGGHYGSVMAYDGTGMTAGPDQHIAVYPAELASEDFNAADDQGDLWNLVRRLETVSGSASYQEALRDLFEELRFEGWYVSQDGVLRYINDGEVMIGARKITVKAGDLVFGKQIRDTLTPTGGQVPKMGHPWDRASQWALLFHLLTAHPDGFAAQFHFGTEHLVKRTKRRKLRPDLTLEQAVYGREVTSIRLPGPGWDDDVDLALCVYHAHSVNAPAIANRAIDAALAAHPNRDREFARALIRLLGNSTWGQWDDDIANGRYQRTRNAARKTDFWDLGLFDGPDALMPKDLPG